MIIVTPFIPGLVVNKADFFETAKRGGRHIGEYFVACHTGILFFRKYAHENNHDVKGKDQNPKR